MFDESSGIYLESLGVGSVGLPHKHFIDRRFIDVFKNSNIDYLIWYAPNKSCSYNDDGKIKRLFLPTITIYDVKNFMKNKIIKNNLYDYDEKKMISSEL